MPLTEEQIKQIKAQLLKQIESFPSDQREKVKQQIEEMNSEELEEFLVKNNLVKISEKEGAEQGKQECIFCSILQGKAPSYRIDENKKALAILEINPLSPGHSLVLSKEHGKLPNQAFSLANRLAKRVKSRLKTEDIKIENSQIMGHNLINVIPLYKDKKLEKIKADEKELILLQDKLKTKQRQKKEKKPKPEEPSEIKQVPRRIP
jgi:histidine triad (HIT) family protein